MFVSSAYSKNQCTLPYLINIFSQKGLSVGERAAYQILVVIEEIMWNHRAFKDIGSYLEKLDGVRNSCLYDT